MASPFWSYFHDKLNWLPIFRPGPLSAIMKGLALHLDDCREDILWLRRQWNPATCEPGLVERYGQSRGVFRNRFDTDQSYRARVVHAYSWHKLGGKTRGLERILGESGFDAQVGNSEDKDLWAHFRLSLELGHKIFGPDEAALFWWLAKEFKPARSVIEVLATRTEIGGSAYFAPVAFHHTKTQAFTWRWPFELACAPVRCAISLYGKSSMQASPVNREPEPGQLLPRSALSAYTFTRSKICPRPM